MKKGLQKPHKSVRQKVWPPVYGYDFDKLAQKY